jgi:hypothetical protein
MITLLTAALLSFQPAPTDQLLDQIFSPLIRDFDEVADTEGTTSWVRIVVLTTGALPQISEFVFRQTHDQAAGRTDLFMYDDGGLEPVVCDQLQALGNALIQMPISESRLNASEGLHEVLVGIERLQGATHERMVILNPALATLPQNTFIAASHCTTD